MTRPNEIKKILKEFLGDKRYNHTLEVAKEAVKLAKRYGADEEKAEIAALLHDIMKEQDEDIQLSVIAEAGITLDEVELVTKKLWHQIAGMAYAKEMLGIEDEDILNAVRYHTSGRKNMSLLEKVVFIADFTSDDRDFNGVKEMRKLAEKCLEDAMVEGLSYTLTELSHEKKLISRDTIDAYNMAIMKMEE